MIFDQFKVQNLSNLVRMPIYRHMVFGPFLSNLDKNSYTSSGDQYIYQYESIKGGGGFSPDFCKNTILRYELAMMARTCTNNLRVVVGTCPGHHGQLMSQNCVLTTIRAEPPPLSGWGGGFTLHFLRNLFSR